MDYTHDRGRPWPFVLMGMLLVAALTALAMALVQHGVPAGADHGDPNCTVEDLVETCTYTEAGAFTIPAPFAALSMSIEVWGGGGGGAGNTFDDDVGGGGGGGGAYASVSDVAVEPGALLDIQVGAGGAGANVGFGGENGGDSWVMPQGGDLETDAVVHAGGGAGGSFGTGGAGGTPVVGSGTSGGRGGGTGTNERIGGGGGGASGRSGGNGPNGSAGTTDFNGSSPIAGAGGGSGAGAGGYGGGCRGSGDGGCTYESPNAGSTPGGGGGGGMGWNQPPAGSNMRGANGAAGRVVVTYQLAEMPTVAKSAADATADRDFAWDIVLTNPLPAAQTLAVVDSDVTLMGVAGDGTCAPDFDADGRLECTVDAGGVVTVTVSRAADGCEPSTEANALEGFSYLDEQGDWQPLAYSSTPVVASVPGDAEACWLPEVTKEGIESIDGAYAWRITIDNDPDGAGDPPSAPASVLLIESTDVELLSEEDGDACELSFGWITCEVPADTEITFVVVLDTDEPSCLGDSTTNSIDEGWVYFVGDHWDPDFGGSEDIEIEELPSDVSASVPGDPTLCWQPEVTKENIAPIEGNFAWRITIDNTPDTSDVVAATAQVVLEESLPVTLAALEDSDACSIDAETLTCDVLADTDISVVVVLDDGVSACMERSESNSILFGEVRFEGEYWANGLSEALELTGLPSDVTATSDGDPEACWQPVITKTGLEDDADWFWTIEIDNDPASGDGAVDTIVEITDPGVTLLPDRADGARCTQAGSVITCPVDAGEAITLVVWQEGPSALSCDTQTSTNVITLARAQFRVGDTFSDPAEWYELAIPDAANASVNRGEGYCLPDDYEIPLPIPSPVGDPPVGGTPSPIPTPGGDGDPDGEPGCPATGIAHATWSTPPQRPGVTIATWGGGNVSEFPAPVATSYWVTLNGTMVGYIPGAPAWVNSRFLTAFPGGEVPPCTPFIVAHR